MTDTIVLHFDQLNSDEVSWRPLGKRPSSQAPTGAGSLAQAAEQIKGWPHLAVISSNEILLTQVSIPAKNQQRLIQAIPFSLENDLTEEIDDLHFSHYSESSRETSVAVVSRERLSAWLERLNQAGLSPRGLYQGVLCLPITTGNWSIFLGKGLSLVRTDTNSGFSIDSANLSLLLTKALNESSVLPKQLDIYVDPDIEQNDAISLFQELSIPFHIATTESDAAELFSENLDERHTINLLQGSYKQMDKHTLEWKKWLPAAVVFVFFIALSMVSAFLDHADYKQQSLALSQQINKVFREAFPEIKRIVDPKVQMEQQFGLADLLAGLADFGKQTTKEEKKISLKCRNCGLTYDDFRKFGRLGCDECYNAFKVQLATLLKKIHGSSQHLGKTPIKIPANKRKKIEGLQDLKKQLQHAILVEDCASACAVSESTVGVALLGTNLLAEHVDILKQYDRVFVALDKDATDKAISMVRTLHSHVPTKLIVLKTDLKNMKRDERDDFIRSYIDR